MKREARWNVSRRRQDPRIHGAGSLNRSQARSSLLASTNERRSNIGRISRQARSQHHRGTRNKLPIPDLSCYHEKSGRTAIDSNEVESKRGPDQDSEKTTKNEERDDGRTNKRTPAYLLVASGDDADKIIGTFLLQCLPCIHRRPAITVNGPFSARDVERIMRTGRKLASSHLFYARTEGGDAS
ncbi:hypothetical protein P692DRAFT_20882186 [Suillus brevipes Sb2]|nr:hypothetical protein P692DRAFT_20882186 [Suillus brevipes Sb2]